MNKLLDRHPLISDQVTKDELRVILRELTKVLEQGPEGDIVEFGCYIGTTSLFIRRVLDQHKQSDKRAFHAYDSFEGLPPKTGHDQNAAGINFTAGELAVSKKQFLHEFHKAGLAPPITHKAWFHDLKPADIPPQIAFAFLDGDFYDSILQSLRLVWPRMATHGAILVHDYKRETLPGVEQALHTFLKGRYKGPLRYEHNVAILHI